MEIIESFIQKAELSLGKCPLCGHPSELFWPPRPTMYFNYYCINGNCNWETKPLPKLTTNGQVIYVGRGDKYNETTFHP